MDEELLSEFLTESNENMASIEEQLMQLEATPDDEDLLNAIFRVIHTVKGSCGFLGLSGLEKVAHAGENLLGKIRALKFTANEDIVSLLLECADAINELLQGLEADGAEPELDHSSVVSRLQAAERLVEGMSGGAGASAPTVVPTETVETAPADDQAVMLEDWASGFSEAVCASLSAAGWQTPEQVIEAGFAAIRGLDGMPPADALKILGLAKSVVAKGGVEKQQSSADVDKVDESANEQAAEEPVIQAEVVQEKAEVKAAPAKETTAAVPVKKTASKPKSAGSIRVDIELLDSLMNQVGELVLTRNRLLQMVTASGSMEFMRVGRELDQVTEHLQSQLLQTRMQPIKTIWGSVPRVVRDMTKQLGKKIDVILEGEDTELDRTILNALKDPLTHIIRNSCDHGIEMPDKRKAAGKSESGMLRLTASQESGYIVILIVDDGGGIDAAKVKAKAVQMGVISEEEAEVMNEQVALQLIFHAGLSTVEKVSNLSGRGVGMDVVRTEIEKVGGSVDISSEIGSGTTLRVRIPLTLAIITAMVVSCRGRRFAIPQISIRELLSAPEKSEEWRVIGGQPFFRLRGRLLPILKLADTLKLDENVENKGSIVVVDVADKTFGLLVDEIFGAEEIVVKPMGIHFRHLNYYGGCSILGDGSVIPIMDCSGLAQRMTLSDEAEKSVKLQDDQSQGKELELQHVLVFVHGDQRYAVPMRLVERLEFFPIDTIEASGSSEVMQYRDSEVIPVLRWADLIHNERMEQSEVYGLILSDGANRVCLQVDKIDDILEVPLDIKKPVEDEFFLGTTVIQGKATEVIDVFDVIKKASPDWFTRKATAEHGAKLSILFVEDSPFFRNLVIPVLHSMQFDVWSAEDGEQAFSVLTDKRPDIVLTDIEMPKVDGYQLAKWVTEQEHLKGVPVLALTSTPPSESDVERRRYFADVLVKFDRHALVASLRKIIASHASASPTLSLQAPADPGSNNREGL